MVKTKDSLSFHKRAIGVASLACVGLAGYFLARAVLVYMTPESAWEAPKFTNTSFSAPASSGTATHDFSFDPFHRDVPVIVADIGGDAPETTLNLKLKGYRAAEDGTAILLTPDNKQAVYKIGDEIIANVTLKAVTSEYIVLSQNGRLERLTYENNATSVLGAVPPATLGTEEPSLEALLSAVNLTPEMQSGKVLGYKIVPKSAGLNLSAIKLQSGDIITQVGSVDLTKGTPDLGRLMKMLKASQSTSVTLIRGGQKMTLKVG